MKRKVILYMSVSLDGFIANDTKNTGWVRGEHDCYQGDYGRNGFLSVVDTVVMGKNTYKEIKAKEAVRGWPYEGMKTYVVTHHPEKEPAEKNIEFVDVKMHTLIQQLQEEEGGNVWIFGGASIVNQLMKDNLIDEYHFTIIPTILGSGMRLFDDKNKEIKLHLVRCKEKNGVIDCLYEKA